MPGLYNDRFRTGGWLPTDRSMNEAQSADTGLTWAPGNKDLVGTALGSSRLWFTLARGSLTEVYYPRIDIPQVKDLGFIVADDKGFWVDLRALGQYDLQFADDRAPAVTVTFTHERFRFRMRVCPHQTRDTLLIDFALEGEPGLRPYVLMTPRPGGDGEHTRGYATRHHGRRALWAEQGPFGVSLMARDDEGRDAFTRLSAGDAGSGDGWQDFARNGRMQWEHDTSGPGESVLTGELPPRGTLALGLSTSKEAASTLALASLAEDFDRIWQAQIDTWAAWAATLHVPAISESLRRTFARSAFVLKTHGDRTFQGAMVASLAVPWGESSTSRGGYHLVWPRDLVESATALSLLGAQGEARDVLRYLIATQQEDGHWLQNQWLGGKPYWEGVQLDETAFPVLLAGMLADADALDGIPVTDMVRRALAFLAANGPSSAQDRWEEDAGVNTFTLAVMIAALVEGAALLPRHESEFALMLADAWNARIEDWTWTEGSELARQLEVSGYYLRVAPRDVLSRDDAKHDAVTIKNRSHDNELAAEEQLATGFLQLVRYGLRRADDPKIVESVRAIDALLRSDTPNGPVWHRYNNDGYGEHRDGRPFDGTGLGRGWPLLTGERGHYALAAGEDPLAYLKAMAAMTGPGGMLPEQVWDTDPLPAHGLYPGQPTGSAMPLVWAHAEFIKLALSRERGVPGDRPPNVWKRYRGERPSIDWRLWVPDCRPQTIPQGHVLRVMLPAAATVHWGINGWQDVRDTATDAPVLGMHLADLATRDLPVGSTVQMTFHWQASGSWQGQDYQVEVTSPRG